MAVEEEFGIEIPNRLLKNDFFGIFYSKNPMIMRVIFQKHGFFNSLLTSMPQT